MATETILHILIRWPQRLFCTVLSNGHRDYSAQSHSMAIGTILHSLIQWPQGLFCTVSFNGHRGYSAQSHPMAIGTILHSLIQWPQRLFCTVSSNGHRVVLLCTIYLMHRETILCIFEEPRFFFPFFTSSKD